MQGRSETISPTGDSSSASWSTGGNNQKGWGLTERESMDWNPNDTLELNYDRDRFVLQTSPGAEFAHYGPSAVLCRRGGAHITYEEVRRLTYEALNSTDNKILPESEQLKIIASPEMPSDLKEKRRVWLEVLDKTATQIRQRMS